MIPEIERTHGSCARPTLGGEIRIGVPRRFQTFRISQRNGEVDPQQHSLGLSDDQALATQFLTIKLAHLLPGAQTWMIL